MASTEKAAPCLMCLDKPAVRTIEDCQHSFCQACLSFYSDREGTTDCPACKGKCKQKEEQVETDSASGASADADEGMKEDDEPDKSEKETNVFSNKHQECGICCYRGKKVKATKVCAECRNIPMCPSCVQDHGENKLTQDHILSDIVSRKEYGVCDPHELQLELLCKTCAKFICYVCMPLEHTDHDIEPLADIIRNDITEIQSALGFEQSRLTRLERDETYLQKSMPTAQDMEDTLIKAIEDHTEKVIEEALTNKETLKKEVRSTFKLIGTFAKWLDAIPELLKTSKGVLARGEKVLHEAELDSNYVNKLRGIKQELEKLKSGEADYDKEKDTYREAYENLCKFKFYPRSPNMNIGGFEDPGPRCDAGGSCVCETCQKRVAKLPHLNRVHECRDKKYCTCGTCGSKFNREKLDGGYCRTCVKSNHSYSNSRIANPYHNV